MVEGTHIFHIGKYGCSPGGTNFLGTIVSPQCHTLNGAIYGKITFSFRPGKAIFVWTWRKLIYDLKNMSVKAVKELHINDCWIQQNEKPIST